MSTTPFARSGLRLWPWFAAVVTGVLLALSLPPWNQGWLAWIGLTPLLSAIWFPRAGKSRPFLLGYLAGIVFYTISFSWLSSLGPLFKAPLLAGIPLLLALYLALYIGLWSWSIHVLAPRGPITASSSLRNLGTGALIASAWVALEWTRGWFLSGFGWNGLGVALHKSLAMLQIVDITGVLGLSWLLVFCNAMAVIILRRILVELGPGFLLRVRWEFSGSMAVVALVFSYGAHAVLQPATGATTRIVIGTIQPNVPQDVKFDESSEEMILQKLEELTSFVAVQKPHVILWPEAPAVRGIFADETNYRFVMKLAATGSFDLLIGSLDYEPDPEKGETMRVYNAAYLLREHGTQQQVYRKVHLVPFGEYLPLRAILPQAIGDLIASDLQAGKEPTVFTLSDPAVRVGPLICFEDSLGELTRRFSLSGAQLLVNLTNDGWFQKTAGAEVHLANAVFRAVENRRPLVRCSNTGYSGTVSVKGVWEQSVAPFTEGFASYPVAVPAEPPTTFYMRFGDWLGYFCGGILAVWLILRTVNSLRARRRSNGSVQG